MSAPWTEAHRREALIRVVELLAFALRRDLPLTQAAHVADSLQANCLLARGAADVATEAGWRRWLGLATKWADADREVRRVRGLAEGRLVRETGWRAILVFGERGAFQTDRDDAQDEADEDDADDTGKGRIVRVTRIRRAS